jgi:hypothetical protein
MAQADQVSAAAPGGFIESIQSGRMPTLQEYVQYLSTMDPLQAVLLLGLGLVYMIGGYRLYKVLVTANAAFLGFALGDTLGRLADNPHNLPLVSGVAGALLLGVLSWPLMKIAVSVMGAVVGGVAGMLAWQYLCTAAGHPQLVDYSWTGGLLGMVGLGMLTFLTMPVTITLVTSLQGASMAVTGVLSVLLRYERFRPDVEDAVSNNMHILPLLVAVPAVIAVVIQNSTAVKKSKKRS